MAPMEVFERLESEVRSYSRSFPVVFVRALGSTMIDEDGREYLDFFSGAGTLNYGHNDPRLKRRLVDYLEADGILHSLDMATAAKREFLERFERVVLAPRGLRYKVQTPGPTGTNAVEAALKLARKVTRRTAVVFFSNAYHGVSLGALAVTGNAGKRRGAGVPLGHAVPMPFEGFPTRGSDSLAYLEGFLAGPSSGLDLPAAIIVETVQAEGGVRVASAEWLRGVAALARRHGALLIVDDIQVGCGRTGRFFSFEEAGLEPDVVCLSKSISGLGLPLSLVLLKPEIDLWSPGEHNGTFRGNNLAFVAAAEALAYWEDDAFGSAVRRKGEWLRARLAAVAVRHPEAVVEVRGRGMIQGLELRPAGLARQTAAAAFRRGLVIETAGPEDEVLKLLPPLTTADRELERGLELIEEALAEALAATRQEAPSVA